MSINIEGIIVNQSSPCFIIAEGCDNHMGNVHAAKEMVIEARRAGADAIKFQHHLPDEEMLKDIPMSDNFKEPLYDFLKKHALTLKQHGELKDFCKKNKIIYLCTPFSYQAAKELYSIGVNVFKIGSGEMTDIPSITRIAREFKKPMIISTGMSTFKEIDTTYKAMLKTGVDFAFMNCISEYPPSYNDINLGVISIMKQKYPKAVIGHSDHTPDLYTCFAAVALGAKIIEKHIIFDKKQPGPDQSVSINMEELACLVDGIKKIEKASGSKKSVHYKEKQIREWAFRSVVSTKEIKKGAVITGNMVWTKRPGTGIPSVKINEVIGKKAKRNISINSLIRWEDLT